MELEDLCGEHVLDAVDFDTKTIEKWEDAFEDCSVIRFRLGGVVYAALEDPSDGYRGCMAELAVSRDEMVNEFAPIRVVATMIGSHGDKTLKLIDCATGRLVVEVGTCNHDDYYPSFVANFDPTAMATNAATLPLDLSSTVRGSE